MRRRSGYALPMVMMILALLALGFSMLLFTLTASLAESKRIGGQLRAFYACDSAVRLASAVTQRVVTQFPTKTPDELTTLAFREICNTAGGCSGTLQNCPACEFSSPAPGIEVGPDAFMPPTANMEYFAVRVFPRVNGRSVQEGAFRDLNAQQSLVALSTQAIDIRTATVAKARETFTLASLSPFQLMAFSTTPLSWRPMRTRPAPGSSVNIARIGPAVYAGGALALGGGQPLNLVRAVSPVSLSWTSPVKIWDGSVGTPSFSTMTGTGPDGRRANIISRPLLMTAALSTAAPAQPALEQAASARWLLDPPVLGEGSEPSGAKLATQADVRILDGVWFVKPPDGSPIPDWPGIPVWSDHGGTHVAPSTPEELKLMTAQPSGAVPFVGQGDLAIARAWPSTPRRYSYYEFTAGGTMKETTPGAASSRDGVGVVSYGSLSFTAGRIVPGSYSSGGPLGFPAVQPPGPCANPLVGFSRLVSYDQCLPGAPQNAALGLLEAARSGFKDFSAQQAGLAGRVLPMNFDVEQFLIALADGTLGELGSYFCGAQAAINNPADVPLKPDGTSACRPFNGIVYVAATWPGSLNGVTSAGTPAVPPAQGQTTALPIGNLQPIPTFQGNRTYLPRQLCTSSAFENPVTPLPLEGAGAGVRFPGIGCDATSGSNFTKVYGATGVGAGVNALRVFNGRDISRVIDEPTVALRFGTSNGLTIASNLPVYIYGDWNSISGAAAASGVTCPTTGALPPECFFPRTWVAGDRITFVSRIGGCVGGNPGFNDSCARWSDTLGSGNNTANQTFYFGAFSSSLSPSVPQENIESLFRVIERWSPSGVPGRGSLNVVGAMFGMGRAYYQKEPQAVAPAFVPEPDLDWRYLSQLSAQDQPPGTPRFVVGVTSRWRDLR